MRKNRTIVYHPTKGIFVGVYGGYAIFSKNDPTGNYEVYGFESEERANKFFAENVPGMKDSILFEEIETGSEYVSVIDIIKANKSSLDVDDLFLNLPTENELLC